MKKVPLKPLVPSVRRLLVPVRRLAQWDRHTHTHTHTQDKYRNPRCACAPRVKYLHVPINKCTYMYVEIEATSVHSHLLSRLWSPFGYVIFIMFTPTLTCVLQQDNGAQMSLYYTCMYAYTTKHVHVINMHISLHLGNVCSSCSSCSFQRISFSVLLAKSREVHHSSFFFCTINLSLNNFTIGVNPGDNSALWQSHTSQGLQLFSKASAE